MLSLEKDSFSNDNANPSINTDNDDSKSYDSFAQNHDFEARSSNRNGACK